MQNENGPAWWTGIAPALPFPRLTEVFQASLGGIAGIAACMVAVVLLPPLSGMHFFLIAPLGASAVLVFAVPNSPLAQPWSAIAGNTVSAVCGVLAVSTMAPQLAPLAAIAMAFAAMLSLRALHPPGGAVALLVGSDPALVEVPGALGTCLNAGLMTAILVLAGVLFHRFSGRKYPFRTSLFTEAPSRTQRLGLTEEELSNLLSKFHQSTNLGAVDLARLLAAAEAETIHHRFEGTVCADMAGHTNVSVASSAGLEDVFSQFEKSGLPLLPVVHLQGEIAGVISQKAVFTQLSRSRKSRLFAQEPCAQDLLHSPPAVFERNLPLGEAVITMIEANIEVAVVAEKGKFAGLLTRSGLLEAILLPVRNAKAA